MDAQSFGELFVHFRQHGFGYVAQGDGEYGGFAGHFFAVVVGREAYAHVFSFAFFHALDAGFKFGQHLALAENEGVVLCRAAFEGDAVDGAGKVDDYAVAVFGFALHAVEAGTLTAQDVDGFFHFRFAHFAYHFFDFLVGQAAHGDFGEHFETGVYFEYFFVVLRFNGIKSEQAGEADVFGIHDFAEFVTQAVV